MNGIVVLPQKPTGSADNAAFDFSSLLSSGDSVAGFLDSTSTVWAGVDASPSTILGTQSISGNTVNQILTGGVAGTIYKIRVRVTTATGQILALYGYVAVTADPL